MLAQNRLTELPDDLAGTLPAPPYKPDTHLFPTPYKPDTHLSRPVQTGHTSLPPRTKRTRISSPPRTNRTHISFPPRTNRTRISSPPRTKRTHISFPPRTNRMRISAPSRAGTAPLPACCQARLSACAQRFVRTELTRSTQPPPTRAPCRVHPARAAPGVQEPAAQRYPRAVAHAGARMGAPPLLVLSGHAASLTPY